MRCFLLTVVTLRTARYKGTPCTHCRSLWIKVYHWISVHCRLPQRSYCTMIVMAIHLHQTFHGNDARSPTDAVDLHVATWRQAIWILQINPKILFHPFSCRYSVISSRHTRLRKKPSPRAGVWFFTKGRPLPTFFFRTEKMLIRFIRRVPFTINYNTAETSLLK